MESWRHVWREGFVKSMPSEGLDALLAALEADDKRLRQGLTTWPSPVAAHRNWPVESSDAIGFVGWKGLGLEKVGEVEEFFARCCFAADQELGEPAECRHFLNWWDDKPYEEVRRELAHEVRLHLLSRRGSLSRLHSPLPAGFVSALVESNLKDAIAYAVLADWLGDNDRHEEEAICRNAARALGDEHRRVEAASTPG